MRNFYKIITKNTFETAILLKENFDQFKNTSVEEIEDKLSSITNGLIFEEERTKVNPLIRLTLPFAFLLYLLMLITLPIKFILTGTWSYRSKFLTNWFNSLNF